MSIERSKKLEVRSKAAKKISPFDEFYGQLNKEQKQAVETIEGPVMVLAGPGTGKTQVLTMRIAHILRKTQMNPRNILALTFTDNAAHNMRKRLVSLIGTEAYGVSIYTFHSFANLVITEFPYKFQFARELQQLDEIEQIEIVESLIDRHKPQELRPPRAPYHYVKEIITRIAELKRENISPMQLLDLAEKERERLTSDEGSYHTKGAHKGEMKALIVEELKQLAKCQEIATLYEAYQQTLEDKGLYDYEDMILFVIKAFESDPELKAYYQERFQYILVDEYQDTNNAQNRLVEQLADFFESPNLFVVGDDKQSIFRFQGASMTNILHFYEKYPSIKVINLKQNYRSHQTILDGASEVMSKATERITDHLPGVKDELVANKIILQSVTASEAKQSGLEVRSKKQEARIDTPINLGVFPTIEAEQYWIVNKIKELIESGVTPGEIAIIYKENREAEVFTHLLDRLSIAYSVERGSNVLLDTDIKRLITMLRVIENPTDSASLFATLHYDFIGIDSVDLLKLMSYRAKTHKSLVDVLDSLPCSCKKHLLSFRSSEALAKGGKKSRTGSFTDVRDDKSDKPVMLNNCQRIEKVYRKIGEWRVASANKPLLKLLEQILQESGLFRQISESPDKLERLHRLRRFFDEVKRLNLRTSDVTVRKLLDHLDRLISHGLQLVPEPFELGEQGTVRLMTAHKAKGLEFRYVFILNLVDKHWGNATRRTLIKLPLSIVKKPAPSTLEKNEDDRRLFYVALTRAKECLYLTFASRKEDKEQLPSQFIEELGENTIKPISLDSSNKMIEAHLTLLFSPYSEATFSDQEAAYLREIITEQPLSPTGLNNYLRCPRGYFYKHLLRVPGTRTAAQSYGTAIHAAMQHFFQTHRVLKHIPGKEELTEAFRAALTKEILSKAEQEDFLRVGTKVLNSYYDKQLARVTPTVAVEYSFAPHHVTLPSPQGEIVLTGIVDKLELINPKTNSVRAIDFKTGRVRSRNEIEGKTATADEDYKRQLVFYQMLSELDRQFPYRMVETALAFVDDDCRFTVEKFTISREEVESLKDLIRNVYAEMLKLEFPHFDDPKRPACDFCSL